MARERDMPNGREVLALEMPENDANARTVREYLGTLLMQVWRDADAFNGKRPFGNSAWEWDLFVPLAHAGYLGEVKRGKWDGMNFTQEQRSLAVELIERAIQVMTDGE